MTAPALVSDKIIPALKAAAGAGVDVDAALDQLANLVELAGTNTRKGLISVKTEIGTTANGDPLMVGWDTCYECKRHVMHCACGKGPTQPPYIAKWVAEELARREGLSTDVGKAEISKVPFSPEAVPDSGESAFSPGATESVGVPSGTDTQPCRGCGNEVDGTMADLNDDGTMSCFACQAASV